MEITSDAHIEALIRRVVESIHGKRPSAECELFMTRQLQELSDALAELRQMIRDMGNYSSGIKDIKTRLSHIEKFVETYGRERQARKKFIGFLVAGVGFVIMRTMWDLWEWFLAAIGVK